MSKKRTRLDRAVRFAVRKHSGSYREGPGMLPYMVHPVVVANILNQTGGVADEVMLCAALLHDTLEDTETSSKEIKQKFGKKVCRLVLELTREEPTQTQFQDLPAPELKQLRSTMLLTGIKAMSDGAKAIKLADRIDNLRGARKVRTGADLAAYLDQSRKILNIIPQNVNPSLWRALEREINEANDLESAS